jgi:hypothetical protein
MDFLDDPDEMAPEERLAEIAVILAAGYLRMRRSTAEPAPTASPHPFTEKPLDSSREPLPLCDQGLTDGESVPAEVER